MSASAVFVSVAAGFAAVYVFLQVLSYLTHDTKEPPVVTVGLPFISASISLLKEKSAYFSRLRRKYNLPIYTLQTPGKSLYVLNDLHLVRCMDRDIRNLAFAPIERDVVGKVVGLSDEGFDVLGKDMDSKDGLLMSYTRNVAPASAPGAGLDAMNRDAIDFFAQSFEALAAEGGAEVDLFDWGYHQIFAATTRATYGPHDPMAKNDNYRRWVKLEDSIPNLVMGLKFGTKDSIKARDAMIADFRNFFNEKKHNEGSLLLKLRRKHFHDFGLSHDDAAVCEVGHVNSFTTSSARGLFWMIWQIFSKPEILKDCREEVMSLVEKDSKTGTSTVDLAQLKTACPKLEATFREVLRFHTCTINAREVQEDTVLDGKYLLKKGNNLILHVSALHKNEQFWGPTAGEFNHRRFLKNSGFSTPSSAFRPFGAGHVLCPGRHFVSTEILSFTALMLLRFDLQPVNGKWAEPKKDYLMSSAFPTPMDNLKFKVIPRSNEKWRVLYSDNGKTISLTEEDPPRDQ